MANIIIINGPNLNLLGSRETDVYGKVSIGQINEMIEKEADALSISVTFKQSNHEGEIIELIQKANADFDGIILNPAGYTHTSIAIRDAVSAISIPVIEVHLSNIYSREEFRHKSLISPVAKGQVCGFGPYSYIIALKGIVSLLS